MIPARRASGGWLAVVALVSAIVPAVSIGVGAAHALVIPRGVAGDTVRIYNSRELRSTVLASAVAAAADVGARSAVFDQGTLGLISVKRSNVIVQRARVGFRFPISTVVTDAATGEALYGSDVGDALAAGDVVMGEAEATMRGAEVGDMLSIKGWNGSIRSVRIGAISATTPGEVLMETSTARLFALRRHSWVTIWDIPDRTALDRAAGKLMEVAF